MKPNCLLMLLILLSFRAWGDAGEIRFVQGDVRIEQSGGRVQAARRGQKVQEGDTIVTGPLGYVQLTMTDDAVIAVRPDTRLKLEIYRYDGKDDRNEKGVLSLLRGGFRTITGWIGHRNKDAYQVRTPTATIGIRGTDHEPLVIPVPTPGETPLGTPGTYDKVNTGQTVIQTPNGRIELGANQVGFAAALPGAVPVRLPQLPSFMRSTPPVRPDARPSGQGAPSQGTSSESATGTGSASSSGVTANAGTTAGGSAESSSTATATGTSGASTSSTSSPTGAMESGSSTAPSLAIVPTPVLAPPPQPGTIDPRYATISAVAAPTGFAVAGGDVTTGWSFNNGAGYVGNPAENMTILLDGSGLPLSVVTSGGFSYDRNGAALVYSDSTTMGGKVVNWGIYAGGILNDNQGVRYPQYFFFMGGGDATTPISLATTLPTPGMTLSFGSVAGYTKPITESGNVGGSISSNYIELKNLAGQISVSQYNLNLTDALGRSWSASMQSPQLLANFIAGGGMGGNLTVFCPTCAQSTGTGSARGVPLGNPTPVGFMSSYSLQAGTSGVTGAVLTKP
ncbi:MAG: FecR domain-containing protein [Betaproteobacteria bacterium]